jgi:hypothetical protein
VATAGVATWPLVAGAHATGSGLILLLPTHLYIAGGAITVAVSFTLMMRVSPRLVAAAPAWRLGLGVPVPVHRHLATATSLGSLAVTATLVVAGVIGSRDPLANPLPLFVWSVWWIGLSYAHAAFGDLWAHLNPWTGFHRVVTTITPLRRWRESPPLPYPGRAAGWVALAGLLGFVWFELIHPAPADPAVLAQAVAAYLLVHLVGGLLFGPQWLRQAETFAVFFRMISWLAPLGPGRPPGWPRSPDASAEIELRLPALRLVRLEPPGASGVAFILLVLAAVSFDGLSRSFVWFGLLGVNPLVHPGRTALMTPNTLGLVGSFTLLTLAYLGAVRLTERAHPARRAVAPLPAVFVLSLVPIACGYHFAHYLPVLLVDVQHALRAASDPFASGWNLFGTRDLHVVTSFLSDPARVYAIWHSQVALIVVAHIAGVVVAHGLAWREGGRDLLAARSQLPVLALMIAYTMLGLWLLSTPTIG